MKRRGDHVYPEERNQTHCKAGGVLPGDRERLGARREDLAALGRHYPVGFPSIPK